MKTKYVYKQTELSGKTRYYWYRQGFTSMRLPDTIRDRVETAKALTRASDEGSIEHILREGKAVSLRNRYTDRELLTLEKKHGRKQAAIQIGCSPSYFAALVLAARDRGNDGRLENAVLEAEYERPKELLSRAERVALYAGQHYEDTHLRRSRWVLLFIRNSGTPTRLASAQIATPRR